MTIRHHCDACNHELPGEVFVELQARLLKNDANSEQDALDTHVSEQWRGTGRPSERSRKRRSSFAHDRLASS